MKKLILMTLMLLAIVSFVSAANAAEWLACDIPDAAQDVVSYAVIVDSDPEVIVPYLVNLTLNVIILWDITALDTAHFEIYAINSQGRRSASAPFDLRAAPLPPSGFRIIPE